VKSILIDAGPIIGLFDKSDKYHLKAIHFMKDFKGELWTTWPVITEVCHMLDFNVKTQLAFLEWIQRGGLQIFTLEQSHLIRVITLTEKFSDVPMDLADASLIVASENTRFTEIASIDSDFYIYRDIRKKYLQNIFL
jgi:predicted nucleic acid-binding protein